MLRAIAAMKSELDYNPTLFARMVAEHGAAEAAVRVITGPDSSGVTTLWRHGRLDLSAEVHALLPQWEILFTDQQGAPARRRLKELDFDVDGYLLRAEQREEHGR
jgi:hypothetical protein